MNAYHGKPEIKAALLVQLEAHASADEIIKGTYWENGRGCAVGCTIHGSDLGRYETELGIPRVLARLEDGIFESLPMDRAKAWPLQFAAAITVGSDLSMVWPRFALWLLDDPDAGVIRHAKTDRTRKAIEDVAALYRRWVGGDKPSREEWLKARSADAADAADAYACATAATATAADAADVATAAATATAADAADAAYADARQKSRIAQSEKLLALIAESK